MGSMEWQGLGQSKEEAQKLSLRLNHLTTLRVPTRILSSKLKRGREERRKGGISSEVSEEPPLHQYLSPDGLCFIISS